MKQWVLSFYWDNSEVFNASRKAQKRLLKQWTHTAKAFGIHTLLVIGKEVPRITDREVELVRFDSYADVRMEYSKAQFVVITGQGTETIENANLPHKQIVFQLGSNYSDPEIRPNDITIKIDADIPLWDVVAAGIVLHGARKWR